MARILPPVVHSPSASPLTAIREAVAWARRLGLFVRPVVEFHGVECTSTLGEAPWVLARELGGLDPIGAAILKAQPLQTDLDRAAAEALGGSVPYSECFAAALRGEPMPHGWRLSSAYLVGLCGHSEGEVMRQELPGGLRVVTDDEEPETADIPAETMREAIDAADKERV